MRDKRETEALKQLAPECPRKHICLEDTTAVNGKVDYCVNEKVLFVKQEKECYCPYLKSFGYSHYCSCPVRMQLYLEAEKSVS